MKQDKAITGKPSNAPIEYVSIEGDLYPLDFTQTQVQYIGNWYEIMEDQEGKPYIMAGYRLQAIYLDLPDPSPSIPVKEGQEELNITSPLWEVAVFEQPHGKDVVIKESILKKDGVWQFADRIAEVGGYGDKMNEANAKAICTAVNNTYGKGFDPSKMEELYKALQMVVDYCNTCNHEVDLWDAINGNIEVFNTALKNAKL